MSSLSELINVYSGIIFPRSSLGRVLVRFHLHQFEVLEGSATVQLEVKPKSCEKMVQPFITCFISGHRKWLH
jgi:hypothetical protein